MIVPSDFARESYRIDEQIWDAIALRSGETALFVGIANDGAWIARAVEIGVAVSVIGGDDATMARIVALGATAVRGSATMVPARDATFDVAVIFHYLHEVDPGFHAQIVQEMARVGRRLVIVEPSPPADPLGRRIAALYARAKREAGLFEQYQPIEYWRKLLAIVKADVWQSLFTFTRVPPRHAVAETVSLVLQAMAIEEMPVEYLDELRKLAARRDAQLLPLSRIVLVGTSDAEALPQGGGTKFRPNVDLSAPERPVAIAPPPQRPAIAPPARPAAAAAVDRTATAISPTVYEFRSNSPELPPPPAPPQPSTPAAPPARQPAPAVPPAAPGPPFGAPFAVPDDEDDEVPFGAAAAPGEAQASKGGFGWAWEPPEGEPKPDEGEG